MLNRVVIQGRIGKDIELRHTQSGVSVVAVSVKAVLCVVVYFSLTREDDGLTKAQRRELKAARKAAAKGGK